jgi:CBS domain-containing protein
MIRTNEVQLLLGGHKVPTRRFPMAGVTLYGAFGGYGILKRVASVNPTDYFKTLWTSSAEFPVWIGSCKFSEPFDNLLQAYNVTKFGGARVVKGSSETIVTLADVVDLIRDGKLSADMSTEEVSTIPAVISTDHLIIDAIRRMLKRNVRRLFTIGGKGDYISDRSIIDFMFSPERLEIARASPEEWINEKISKLGKKSARRCPEGPLDAAAKMIGDEPDDCLMTEGSKVVSRWDLTVKPWKVGKLSIVAN